MFFIIKIDNDYLIRAGYDLREKKGDFVIIGQLKEDYPSLNKLVISEKNLRGFKDYLDRMILETINKLDFYKKQRKNYIREVKEIGLSI